MANIYQKLLNVRKSVPFLQKDADGPQFKYISAAAILAALRKSMDDEGLLLVPQVTGKELREYESEKGTQIFLTELNIDFTWVNAENPDEHIRCPWYSQGIDYASERGVGKAMTYAEKYFLLKFFNIPTEKADDPDAGQQQMDFKPKDGDATEPQRKKIYAMVKNLDVPESEVKKWMWDRYEVESSKELTKKQASDFIEFLTKLEEMKKDS